MTGKGNYGGTGSAYATGSYKVKKTTDKVFDTGTNGYSFVGSKTANINIVSRNIKNVKNLFGETAANFINSLFNSPEL